MNKKQGKNKRRARSRDDPITLPHFILTFLCLFSIFNH